MTKTYKHKTLGWIATLSIEKLSAYRVVDVLDNFICTLPEELITQDRIEVVEKDWKELCVDEIFEYQRGRPGDEPDYVSIRKIIEKHLPQPTLIKFTRNDLWEFSEKHFLHLPYNRVVEGMIIFLKAHNLYSDTD